MDEAYISQPPRKQAFYRNMADVLQLTGLGNKTWWGYAQAKKLYIINSYIVISAAPFCFFSPMMYMYKNYSKLSFNALGTMYSIIPVALLANVKLLSASFKSYKKIMIKFMDEIHLYSYSSQNEFARKTLIRAERYTRWTMSFLFVFLFIDWALWMILPIVYNIKHMDAIRNRTDRLQTCLYVWMPFNYEYDWGNWAITHSFNIYIAAQGCTIIVFFDTLNFAFVYHLIGHIDILKYNIKTQFIDNMTDEEIKQVLVNLIKYHSFIIRTFKDVESAFGLNVAGNYFQNLIEDSLILYLMMVGEKESIPAYALMFVVYLGGLVLISFVLEDIRRQSDDFAALVYQIPWQNMSISNQKMLVLFLKRVQITLEFKAAGGLKAGVNPMASIIKSTFSYYVMLKSSVTD